MDVDVEFEHNLKPKVKKRRKRKSNLSLNQSKKKRKKYNYSDIVRIKKCDVYDNCNDSKNEHVSTGTDAVEINHLKVTHCPNEIDKTFANESINEILQNENEVHLNNSENNKREETYFQNCLDRCTNDLIKPVLENFDREGLLIHFMAFMSMIANGQLSVANMAVLLCMEVGLLFSLASTTQIRYREDTSLFWEVVLSVGGPRTLRLFSSDKHQGKVNSGECERSKYKPQEGSFNFAVPDEKLLRRSKTGLPKCVKCGIIQESMCLLEKGKEYVLAVDGKQTSPGLLNDTEGDVNLWGYEGPPTLAETMECLSLQENFILDLVGKASRFDSNIKDIASDLKIVVQLVTKRIKNLREAKVRYEQLRSRFKKKIAAKPDIGSRYDVAFSDINSFIRRADIAIKNLLEINVEWCGIMAAFNGNEHSFRKWGPILLDTMLNSWILRSPETLQLDDFLKKYPEYMKQRSELWYSIRKESCITGSTLHSAIGLRTLKEQKEHFKKFISKIDKPIEINKAMQHGIDNEVCKCKCTCDNLFLRS